VKLTIEEIRQIISEEHQKVLWEAKFEDFVDSKDDLDSIRRAWAYFVGDPFPFPEDPKPMEDPDGVMPPVGDYPGFSKKIAVRDPDFDEPYARIPSDRPEKLKQYIDLLKDLSQVNPETKQPYAADLKDVNTATGIIKNRKQGLPSNLLSDFEAGKYHKRLLFVATIPGIADKFEKFVNKLQQDPKLKKRFFGTGEEPETKDPPDLEDVGTSGVSSAADTTYRMTK
jgi:hypothetical protein